MSQKQDKENVSMHFIHNNVYIRSIVSVGLFMIKRTEISSKLNN